jgi:serine/threonine protein kinase
VVETLSVFRCEENGSQYLNFLFPLALGNLSQLFLGRYDKDVGLQTRAQKSLWGQFAGLSSAVAYLHSSIQVAHRDIKPSNIFIHEDPEPGGTLMLKLTGFGLSTDLRKEFIWKAGSVAQPYDSPGFRRPSPDIQSRTPSSERLHAPSATEMLADDIWKLGYVFIEMLAFLVCGGSEGVVDFRDSIRTDGGNVFSDRPNNTRFDRGAKVKIHVINWLDVMARKDMRAKHLEPILAGMLAKSAQRPTIEEVCQALVEVSIFFLSSKALFTYHWL